MTPTAYRGPEAANGSVDPELLEALRGALLVLAAGKPAPPEEKKKEEKKKPEDSMPLFFKLCSAALISVAALIAVTLYNQMSGSLNAQKNEISLLSARSNDLVAKEKYNTRLEEVADTIKKAQAANKVSLEYWKEQTQAEDRKIRNLQEDTRLQIRDLERELQRMRERLTALERESSVPVAPPPIKGKKDGKN